MKGKPKAEEYARLSCRVSSKARKPKQCNFKRIRTAKAAFFDRYIAQIMKKQ